MNFKYLRILNAQHWAYVTNGKYRLCLYQTPACVFAFDADTDEKKGKAYTLKFFYILNELKKIGYNYIIYAKEKVND